MEDLNDVFLIGRLTRDGEMNYTNNGTAVMNFSIAVNRRHKNGERWEDEAHFFDCALWGKSAEALAAYLLKGKQVALKGELRQDRWVHEGQKRSKVKIHVIKVQLLGGRSEDRQQSGARPQVSQGYASIGAPAPSGHDYEQGPPEDDIPY